MSLSVSRGDSDATAKGPHILKHVHAYPRLCAYLSTCSAIMSSESGSEQLGTQPTHGRIFVWYQDGST